eukprot:GGOE01011733.1.p1 GENE.GGOE01011733.1~~GGOE01011733.1.p1  ORF type:complete len:204 (+),score=42.21 GGOE01011733.1:40-612(+)
MPDGMLPRHGGGGLPLLLLLLLLLPAVHSSEGMSRGDLSRAPRKAIVQILWDVPCGDVGRALGPLVTHAVLRSGGSAVEHVLLANNVCHRIVRAFTAAGILVHKFRGSDLRGIKPPPSIPPIPRQYLQKMLAFQLPTFQEGDLVLLLDDDAILVRTVDELFELPFERQEMWAAPGNDTSTFWPENKAERH